MTVEESEDVAAALATLEAIRRGEVDALVISTPDGDRVFTLVGADEAYRIIVEGMQQGAVTVSMDGTILYCNPRFAQMLRIPKETVVGRVMSDLVAPLVRSRFSKELEASSESRTFFETFFERGDGSILPVTVASSRVDFGSFKAWAAVISDSSEQSAALRHALLASLGHRLLRSVDPSMEYESICSDLVTVSGADRARLIVTDPRSVAGAGAPWPAGDGGALPPDCCRKTAVLHDTSAPVADLGALASWYRENGIGSALVVAIGPGSGPYGWIELTSDLPRLVAEWEVELAAVFAVTVEAALLRQRVSAEREDLARELEGVRREAGLGNLASNLAHEFNNVLMAISPQSDVIRRIGGSDFAIGRACASIAQSVQRGKSVTRDILQFTRPPEIEPRPVAVATWMESVAGAIGALPRTVRFSWSVAPSLEETVLSIDAVQARNAMLRMAESLEFSGAGDRRVTLEALATDGRRVHFLLRHDTPVPGGLDLAGLFEPLSSGNRGLSGLSLGIARRTVEGHGGTLEAEAEEGMLTFRFTLPLAG